LLFCIFEEKQLVIRAGGVVDDGDEEPLEVDFDGRETEDPARREHKAQDRRKSGERFSIQRVIATSMCRDNPFRSARFSAGASGIRWLIDGT